MFTSPAIDVVGMAARLGHTGGYDRWRSRVRGLPEFGGELPVACLAEEIETPGTGQVCALVTSAGNPVLSTPNGARLERALARLDFMLSIDIYLNETTRHAHLILPPTFALERDHYDLAFTVVSVRNVARYSPPLFPRGADQRHDWEIYAELSARLEAGGWLRRGAARLAGVAARRLGPRAILEVGLRTGPHKLSLREVEAATHGLDLGPLEPRLPGALYTPGRRIRLVPDEYLRDLPRLEATLDGPPPALVLIGRRQLRSNNSWMHNAPRLVKGPDRCTLLMHPTDAAARGLAGGDRVRVRSRAGEVEAPLEVSDEMMPGVVSLPHGWGHYREGVRLGVAARHAGASLNDLTDELRVDPLGGTAAFSGVPVEVRPAAV
jgi:anaerobic selenocysteine-containing dehydrogenase